MKLKKGLCLLLSTMIIGSISLIGCTSKENKESIKIAKEITSSNIKSINVVLKYDKSVTEDKLTKIVQNLVDKYKKDNTIKGLIVQFYEKESDSKYSDIIPYAVGGWLPDEGLSMAMKQITTRNNKVKVEFSQEKDVPFSDEEIKLINTIIKEYKDKGLTLSQAACFYYTEHEEEINDTYSLTGSEFLDLITNYADRYETNALDTIKNIESKENKNN